MEETSDEYNETQEYILSENMDPYQIILDFHIARYYSNDDALNFYETYIQNMTFFKGLLNIEQRRAYLQNVLTWTRELHLQQDNEDTTELPRLCRH